MQPRRFVDDPEDRFEAQLLRAARRDAPPRGALKRAEAALALGVGAGAAATATATVTAKAASAQLGAHTVGAAGVLKWLGIGVASGLVVTSGVRYGAEVLLHTSRDRSAPAHVGANATDRQRAPRAAHRVASTTASTEDRPVAPPEPSPSLPSFEELPAEPPGGARKLTRAAATTTAGSPVPSHTMAPLLPEAIEAPASEVPPVPSLSNELSILERARHALVQQDPGTVLRELDAYSRLPGGKVLDAEAKMLAIEALVQQGNVGEAQARARGSLASSPSGPHAARLRQILALPDR